MKIASRKKKIPSIANRIPKTLPNRPVNAGHRSPNSNESTVPGHRADREQDRRDLRPALRELERDLVVACFRPM